MEASVVEEFRLDFMYKEETELSMQSFRDVFSFGLV